MWAITNRKSELPRHAGFQVFCPAGAITLETGVNYTKNGCFQAYLFCKICIKIPLITVSLQNTLPGAITISSNDRLSWECASQAEGQSKIDYLWLF